MKHLKHSHIERLLSSVALLYSDIVPKTLSERALAVVNNLISNEVVAFDFFNLNVEHKGKHWYNPPDLISESEFEIFENYVQEHPLFNEIPGKLREEPMKISDFLRRHDFHKTGIYNEFYRLYRIDHQLCVTVSDSPDTVVTCTLSRTKQDFAEHDRTLLSLLAPHLTNALCNARTFERLRQNEERLMSIVKSLSNGIIALDRDNKVQFISEHTRTLLGKYFNQEKITDKKLPEDLQQWILKYDFSENKELAITSPQPLVIERESSVLRISLMFNT
jgi:hypothetical protein